MKKFIIVSLVLIGIIGATAVLAQSFSAGTSTDQSQSSADTTTTNNKATISAPPSVLSSIKTITNKDANIRRVDIKDDQIIIDYQEATKILGIFPAKFNLHIVTDTVKKQVNLSRPWWTIFGNTRVGKLLQDIRSSLNATNLPNTESQTPKIIQTISNVLRQ